MPKNASVRQYLARFHREFPIPKKDFAHATASFQDRLSDYMAEHPQAAYEELCAYFGEPEEVAAEFLSSFDQRELAEKLAQARSMRRVKTIGILLIIVLLAVIAVVSVIHLIELKNFSNGYYIETIIEGSSLPSYPGAIEVY